MGSLSLSSVYRVPSTMFSRLTKHRGFYFGHTRPRTVRTAGGEVQTASPRATVGVYSSTLSLALALPPAPAPAPSRLNIHFARLNFYILPSKSYSSRKLDPIYRVVIGGGGGVGGEGGREEDRDSGNDSRSASSGFPAPPAIIVQQQFLTAR